MKSYLIEVKTSRAAWAPQVEGFPFAWRVLCGQNTLTGVGTSREDAQRRAEAARDRQLAQLKLDKCTNYGRQSISNRHKAA